MTRRPREVRLDFTVGASLCGVMAAGGLGSELVDPALGLISTAIAIVLEDSHDDALTSEGAERFARLEPAGDDVRALARAAGVLLRRR